ncbi:hypothetical protein CHS0354_041733, partial [Potamilus streckersoni]
NNNCEPITPDTITPSHPHQTNNNHPNPSLSLTNPVTLGTDTSRAPNDIILLKDMNGPGK